MFITDKVGEISEALQEAFVGMIPAALSEVERCDLSRKLDSIAQIAVQARATLEHGNAISGSGARLVKRVRKALGYTYP